MEVVSWQSKLQDYVALFITKVEHIAITKGRKEILWMKKFLQELGVKQDVSPMSSALIIILHLIWGVSILMSNRESKQLEKIHTYNNEAHVDKAAYKQQVRD